MNIVLYGNGGSGNHGCEAIVRGTKALFEDVDASFTVNSASNREDCKYGLDELVQINSARTENIDKNLNFLKAYIKLKLFNNYIDLDGLYYQKSLQAVKGKVDLAFSIGGDNYCYEGNEIYTYLNKEYNDIGVKTVLWGCSIEPKTVKKLAHDLIRYKAIVARESITYKEIKPINSNTYLAPDPAFFMSASKCNLDCRFEPNNVIGINVSPMIISNETKNGVTYENYKNLIKYILNNTNSYVALIPHVVWDSNDDRKVLRSLYEEFDCDSRLILVEDHNAPELKYIISKCRLFVGARTHATIAAYSSCVPTLVVGYSVKARGIAHDLFGTEENYVIPVQNLDDPNQLTESFKWLEKHEDNIRRHLKSFLPEYLKTAQKAVEAIKELE